MFVGTELHYFQQAESRLPLGKSNASFLKEINFEFGYGNLSDLEQKPLSAPWQARLGEAEVRAVTAYVHGLGGGEAGVAAEGAVAD